MAKRWHCQEDFLVLRRRWYDKLSDEGFQDIEKTDWKTGESLGIRGISLHAYGKAYSPDVEDYFRLARALVHDLSEDPEVPERHVRAWSMHAEGTSTSDIARSIGVTRRTIFSWLRKYRARLQSPKPDQD